MNSKAQAGPLSIILVLAIVIAIILGTYTWGRALLDEQESISTSNYVQSKLLQIKNNIIEVTHEGENATRVVRMDLPKGTLTVKEGAWCTGTSINANALEYELTVKDQIIGAEDWIIIDPRENDTACSVSLGSNGPGVLIARAIPVLPFYVNTYSIWFRKLSGTNRAYVINITKGDSTLASGGVVEVVMKNKGVVDDGSTVWTNVEIHLEQ